MNRAALEAAFRLATTLPSKVHRNANYSAPPEPEREYRRTPPAHYGRDAKRCPKGAAGIQTVAGGKQVKWCTGCKCNHPTDEFTKGTGPGGLHRHCRKWQLAWREAARARKAAGL